MTFAERMEELRLANEMTIKELADGLGIEWRTIYRWMKGDFHPNLKYVYLMAGLFGITASQMLEGVDIDTSKKRKRRKDRRRKD